MRVEGLRYASAETRGEPPLRSPRAVNLYPNADRIWTTGVNWYMNAILKMQLDVMREMFSDPGRTLRTRETTFWSYVARLQLIL